MNGIHNYQFKSLCEPHNGDLNHSGDIPCGAGSEFQKIMQNGVTQFPRLQISNNGFHPSRLPAFFSRNSKYFKCINLSSLTVSFRPCYLSKIGKFELTMSLSVIKKSEICTRKTQLRKSGKRFGNWKTKRRRRGGGRRRVLLKNRKEKGRRRGIDEEGRGEN